MEPGGTDEAVPRVRVADRYPAPQRGLVLRWAILPGEGSGDGAGPGAAAAAAAHARRARPDHDEVCGSPCRWLEPDPGRVGTGRRGGEDGRRVPGDGPGAERADGRFLWGGRARSGACS